MNVLVCTPFGPAPHRIHPLTQQSIDDLGCASVTFETTAPVANCYVDLCEKYNRARDLVLDGGYDAMLHIDADMVVPADTLERWADDDLFYGADVIYGLYVMRTNPSHWLCWPGRGMVKPLNERPELIQQHWGGQLKSYGAGMGCTLIRRHALEWLKFRTDGVIAADWNFAQDCGAYGISQVHDLGCVCGHIDGDKVLYPDPDAPKLYRVEKIN